MYMLSYIHPYVPIWYYTVTTDNSVILLYMTISYDIIVFINDNMHRLGVYVTL